MKKYIKSLIDQYQAQVEELEEDFDNFEDFSAYEASGGNFDDAYDMGMEHGALYATLSILCEILDKLDEEEGDE